MISLLAALALAVAEPPAPAAAATAAKPPAATVAEAAVAAPLVYGITVGRNVPKTEKVCFKDPVLGSKIPTRRCMNRNEFEDRQQQERTFLEAVQRDARAPISH